MKFDELVQIVGAEAVFTTGFLLAGHRSPSAVRLQLTRWVAAGRVLQLRRGVYALAPPWRKLEPHPFLVANTLQRGSYVSLQSALAFHGWIPEHVPVATSVGSGRPELLRNPLGAFSYNHLGARLRFGYLRHEVAPRQFAFVASPEKALLDLIHLTPGAGTVAFLQGLRLDNAGPMRVDVLRELAARAARPKWVRAARIAGAVLSAMSEGDGLE